MTPGRTTMPEVAPSLADNVATLDAGAHVTAAAWLGETAAFALGDGGVLLAKDGAAHRTQAHPDGAVLVAAGDGERLVTGGDDGRLAVTGPDGWTREFASTGGRSEEHTCELLSCRSLECRSV